MQVRELSRTREKKILGVAGGFAEYFDMDKTIWRAIWVVMCVMMPPAILAYFILGIVMPEAPAARYQPPVAPPEPEAVPPEETVYTRNSYRQLTKSRDRWLSGVCAGVAEYFDADPVLVRAVWLGAVFLFGTGLLLYIVLAILMPDSPRQMPR